MLGYLLLFDCKALISLIGVHESRVVKAGLMCE